jgi:serine protease Do
LCATLVVIAFTLAACQSDGDSESTDGGAVTSLDGVRSTVIRIVAEGTFVDPDFGEQLNAAGSGSGFIISADGLAGDEQPRRHRGGTGSCLPRRERPAG